MLVAIAIAAMMLGMIVLLFNNTQQAVSLGIHTGDVLVQSETISAALQLDTVTDSTRKTNGMLGPAAGANPAGFLVIVNRKISDVKMPLPTGGESTKTLAGQSRVVRDDQLIFVSDYGTVATPTALTPRRSSNLRNDLTAEYALVWYGHLQRTKADGTQSGTLGIDNPATGPNVLGNQWILGRQALLLDPADLDTTTQDIYADDASWSGTVQHSGASYSSNTTWYGLTDITRQALGKADDDSSISPATLLSTINTASNYVAGVSNYIASAPPLVNPVPETTNFAAWKLAQTHMYLADNVSDFAVDFAGDYVIGRYNTMNPAANNYGVDGKIDRGVDGNIIWYGAIVNNSSVSGYDPAQAIIYTPPSGAFNFGTAPNEAYQASNPNSLANATAFVFRHDDGNGYNDSATPATNSKWPYLLRIRYRLHAPQNKLQSAMAGSTTDPSKWQSITGRWFEQIIKVNRQ